VDHKGFDTQEQGLLITPQTSHNRAGSIPEENGSVQEEEVSTLPAFANAENRNLDAAVRVRTRGHTCHVSYVRLTCPHIYE